MAEEHPNNVIHLSDARPQTGGEAPLVADGTDLAVQAKAPVPVLNTETHVVDLLVTSAMGAGVGFLARRDLGGLLIGAVGGAALGLAEKALLGPAVGVAAEQRVIYGVAALGATIGAGLLSYRWV
jgi:hypothetical protein